MATTWNSFRRQSNLILYLPRENSEGNFRCERFMRNPAHLDRLSGTFHQARFITTIETKPLGYSSRQVAFGQMIERLWMVCNRRL